MALPAAGEPRIGRKNVAGGVVAIYGAAKSVRRVVAAAACACGVGAALFGAGAGSASAQPGPGGWPTFLYNAGHTSYNAGAAAITPSSVANLIKDWGWATPASPNNGSNFLFASPTVSNGVVYVGAEDGYFYAVSEATRTEDGGGVVAAQAFTALHKMTGVYLLNAATGAILGFIRTGSPMFGQAVFTRNDMIIGAGGSFGMQAFHVAPAGSPITNVSPAHHRPGSQHPNA